MPNRLRAGDTDEHVVEQRASNRGPIGKARTFMQEWGWCIYLVGAVALSLGYRYVSPSDEIKEIKVTQSQFQRTLDSLTKVTTSQAGDIRSVSLLQCFNRNYTNGQLRLVGINCEGIR